MINISLHTPQFFPDYINKLLTEYDLFRSYTGSNLQRLYRFLNPNYTIAVNIPLLVNTDIRI